MHWSTRRPLLIIDAYKSVANENVMEVHCNNDPIQFIYTNSQAVCVVFRSSLFLEYS